MQARTKTALLLSSLVLGLAAPASAGGDGGDEFAWPQWRGPHRDGISRETKWVSEGAEESLWEMQVGLGYSAFVVQGGKLVTLGYDEEAGLDIVWCLDALTGEELWAHAYPAKIWNQAHRGGTVNTPTIDGDVVYSLNREGNLFCLDLETGDELWHRQVKEEHDLEYPTWGFSAAPLVLGDELLLNVGRVLRLDKKDGSALWKTKDYGHAYSTPAAFDLEGKPALAVFNGNGVAVLDRTEGGELYFDARGASASRGVNAASPIVIEDAVLVSSMRINGAALLAFGEGELVPVWEIRNLRSQLSGCVLLDDHLYGFDAGILKCYDLEGNETWAERGIGNGALIGTPGRLIVMGGDGNLIVVEATPEEYRELSRAPLFEDGVFWTKPILVNGVIYCRSNLGHVIARDHRGES